MKNILFLLFLTVPTLLFCQMNDEAASKIKRSKLVIELSDIAEVDSVMVRAIKEYWNFNENYRFKKPNTRKKKTKGKVREVSKMSLVLSTLIQTKKFNDFAVNKRELGNAFIIKIENGKKYLNIGFNKYSELEYFDFVEAIKRIQFVMNEIIELGSYRKVFKATKTVYGKELENKVLLVDNRLLKTKLTEDVFRSIYPYNFEFVDKEEIETAVLQNDESKAYFSIAEEKVGLYVQYICNAGNGKIYTHKHGAFQTHISLAKKSFNRVIGVSDLKDLSRRVK